MRRPFDRRSFGAAALLGLAVLAAGCGIRPTAVPVDAGAPASRTACPTVAQIPTAPGTPSSAAVPPAAVTPTRSPEPGKVSAPARAGVASPSPVVVTPSTPPADNAFSAVPSTSPSTAAPCR
ncbi:hypothetical protein [Streptomyces sp. BE303]|uniref:hypothetical protein n=1 Tax=Streptomycetaceae TaxID=2062 RepID=UPI002E762AD3|nr:hypothetical protein [Streptomyces sp. BE303]MED7952221.1 hypothetical protein [Streptomyces sp. BE303]